MSSSPLVAFASVMAYKYARGFVFSFVSMAASNRYFHNWPLLEETEAKVVLSAWWPVSLPFLLVWSQDGGKVYRYSMFAAWSALILL